MTVAFYDTLHLKKKANLTRTYGRYDGLVFDKSHLKKKKQILLGCMVGMMVGCFNKSHLKKKVKFDWRWI